MLKTVVRSTLRVSKAYLQLAPLVIRQPKFNFSTSIETSSKLLQAVQQQIAHEESNIQDLSEFQNFFQNQGWTINYNGVQIQLSKKSGPYDLRILVNAKTPLPADQNQNQNEEQMQEDNADFNDITIYIKKAGAPKWLFCEFMVSNHGVNLSLAAFSKDYETEKADRALGKPPSISYAGPELSSLQQKFHESIYGFIEGVGITGEILQRVSEFSISYEHQFYVQWLKDFRSLV